MRGFFLLLLLTNVATFAWQFYTAGGEHNVTDVYRDIAIVNNGLTLISELPEGQRPALREPEADEPTAEGALQTQEPAAEIAAQSPTTSEGPQGSSARCYRLGEITDKTSAKALVKWLKNNGAESIKQQQQQGKRVTYWVILPAYANRKKANEAAEILSNQRIRDFFIVRNGEHENAISLGVFSTRERAERRYQEIVNLKARLRKPRITTVERSVLHYLVTFQLTSSEQKKALSAYVKREQLGREEEISCK